MRRGFRPYVLAGVALAAAIVLVILGQGRQGGDEGGGRDFSPEEFMRMAELDRSLPGEGGESGREAFRETFDAGAGNSITFEIPPGMAIDVSWELEGGSVQLLLDPSWEDPRIVELEAGSSTRRLIVNGSQGRGRINIRSTPIGEVVGSFTLYAE